MWARRALAPCSDGPASLAVRYSRSELRLLIRHADLLGQQKCSSANPGVSRGRKLRDPRWTGKRAADGMKLLRGPLHACGSTAITTSPISASKFIGFLE